MEYRVLGALEAHDRGRVVELSPRLRDLLAVLLSRAGEPLSVGRIAEALWGSAPPRSGLKTTQVYVHHLRRALGGRLEVEHRGSGYVLAEHKELDADRFEDFATQGYTALAEHDHDGAVHHFRRGLYLWRGPAFDGQEGLPIVREEAARLDALRQRVTEDRVEAELALGHHRDLVAELMVQVAANPLRERLRAQLMIALHRSGRRAEALAVYREGRQLLARELGLEPGTDLRRAEHLILTDAADGLTMRCPNCRTSISLRHNASRAARRSRIRG
ncbi:AfsR/SARP family transcriptional regulator [Actinokineospora sp.]|uniref:AfsR/SARP family transcriptional regulator n=1 Tax=Actinokineospora sp. TaxID=1872133 RepID=UPI003D6C3EA3